MKTLPSAKPHEMINAYVSLFKPQPKLIWKLKHVWLKVTFYRPKCN